MPLCRVRAVDIMVVKPEAFASHARDKSRIPSEPIRRKQSDGQRQNKRKHDAKRYLEGVLEAYQAETVFHRDMHLVVDSR